MIFLFFKPIIIEKKDYVEIPIFELNYFDVYELDREGLKTILSGSNSKKYDDRYSVENIDYTDNSKRYIANMQANHGLYKENIVTLHGDVKYIREDGLNFWSDSATYNKVDSTLFTQSDYRATRGENMVQGTFLYYNNMTKKLKSKNIVAIYKLQESEK